MFIELHLIQNFSPANLNRDDTNNPKDCEFGGHRRARISSQALKRAIRRSPIFTETTGVSTGERTKWMTRPIKDQLVAAGQSEDMALNVATVLGKNYFNFQSIVDEFVAAEAVYVVENAEQAVNTLTQLLFEPALRAQLNQNAQVIMYKNRGSLTEHIHVINQYL